MNPTIIKLMRQILELNNNTKLSKVETAPLPLLQGPTLCHRPSSMFLCPITIIGACIPMLHAFRFHHSIVESKEITFWTWCSHKTTSSIRIKMFCCLLSQLPILELVLYSLSSNNTFLKGMAHSLSEECSSLVRVNCRIKKISPRTPFRHKKVPRHSPVIGHQIQGQVLP